MANSIAFGKFVSQARRGGLDAGLIRESRRATPVAPSDQADAKLTLCGWPVL
jgi:hypothetical protein